MFASIIILSYCSASVWELKVNLNSTDLPNDANFKVMSINGHVAQVSDDRRSLYMKIDTQIPAEGYAVIGYKVVSSLNAEDYYELAASIPYDQYGYSAVQEQVGLNCFWESKKTVGQSVGMR